MSEITKLARKVVTRDKMEEAIAEYKKAELEYALEICPFNIGDEVTILGFSFRGKKGIVDEIIGLATGRWTESHWKVYGKVLNKSGDISKNRFEFDQYDYERNLKKETK